LRDSGSDRHPENTMRQRTLLIFDEWLPDQGKYTTPGQWNAILGLCDQVAFQVLAFATAGPGTLTVTVQHSADNETWSDRSSNALPVVPGSLNAAHVLDSGSPALLPFVRLQLQLSGSTTNARVSIYFTGRDKVIRLDDACKVIRSFYAVPPHHDPPGWKMPY